MIYNIDDIIPLVQRTGNKHKTIREIATIDSGYLKDLFKKSSEIVFSTECFEELKRITKGHKDTNPPYQHPTNPNHFLNGLKLYTIPYLYDFNDEELERLNNERLKG